MSETTEMPPLLETMQDAQQQDPAPNDVGAEANQNEVQSESGTDGSDFSTLAHVRDEPSLPLAYLLTDIDDFIYNVMLPSGYRNEHPIVQMALLNCSTSLKTTMLCIRREYYMNYAWKA